MANNNSSAGVGSTTFIFVALLVLKLTKLVDISWWWVFSPYIITFSILIILIAILWFRNKKRRKDLL